MLFILLMTVEMQKADSNPRLTVFRICRAAKMPEKVPNAKWPVAIKQYKGARSLPAPGWLL